MPFLFNVTRIFQPDSWKTLEEQEMNDQRNIRTQKKYSVDCDEVDCDKVDIAWELFRIRNEELFTVSQLHKARSQQRKGKISEKTKTFMIYIGNTDRCTPYIDLVIENSLSLEEKSSLIW